MTKQTVTRLHKIIENIQAYFGKYVAFADEYSLPLALWIIGTYMFQDFDAFPYLVITSQTKRSGKTRTAELIGFMCSKPEQFSAMTPAGLFYCIEEREPTIFFDEAEVLSSESANNMRAVLNIGYRKGQTVPRLVAEHWDETTQQMTRIRYFKTYCPKVFILIGDVYDTLKDRAIMLRMKRADKNEIKERFVFDAAKAEGAIIGQEIKDFIEQYREEIKTTFRNAEQIEFLGDRDAEIWAPLFSVCEHIAPQLKEKLSRLAVDMSMEKTAEVAKYINLLGAEKKVEQDQLAQQLLVDLRHILNDKKLKHVATMEAIEMLKAIPTAPWRKFRGEGLTAHSMSDLLQVFALSPMSIRVGSGRNGSKVMKGYRKQDVDRAFAKSEEK